MAAPRYSIKNIRNRDQLPVRHNQREATETSYPFHDKFSRCELQRLLSVWGVTSIPGYELQATETTV